MRVLHLLQVWCGVCVWRVWWACGGRVAAMVGVWCVWWACGVCGGRVVWCVWWACGVSVSLDAKARI
nr:hypothetical protein [Vibrio breoganii]